MEYIILINVKYIGVWKDPFLIIHISLVISRKYEPDVAFILLNFGSGEAFSQKSVKG